jgi:hypothetical protein
VSKRRGDIKALLLFWHDGDVAYVLNQLIALDAKELQRFADTLFTADLFGHVPYKYRFLGIGQVFDRIIIYRSRLAMVRHCKLAGRTALDDVNRALRLWLQNAEQKEDWISCATTTAVHALRKTKRFKDRLT